MKVFVLDTRLVRLFEKLSDLNPPVRQMVSALNVVLQQSGSHIESKQDFCDFIEQVERFQAEISSGGFSE
ncbi:conserved hypothetical protein [Vibrio chagasii]|nr:conserved hypothetical protein [Vibrio chagasii]CAH7228370.1 conserved hypothetical protein [Vibrio chagasii]CAH7231427.1 conserved hypothetical protein [Vibrio chagasii]CAH7274684.1 conserved hypothetical protein [Vibrio chagasii]CAH7277948.1 conserved hypothetical protein [Vibrio chagasii]